MSNIQNNAVVTIKDLTVKYDKSVILNNINLCINKGEIIGLLGPSGAGKTTLIKSIIGMNSILKGKIRVFNELIPKLNITSSIGYMAQSDALYEELSGIDNILFFASILGMKGNLLKKRVKDVLTLVDLNKDAYKLVKNYSGGMKRRLSLAIALVHNPKLLILDEPTVGIDPLLRNKFWDEFKKTKAEGGTIILTTHAIDEAYKCDKLALIRKGKILVQGSIENILHSSKTNDIEAAFLFYSNKDEEI